VAVAAKRWQLVSRLTVVGGVGVQIGRPKVWDEQFVEPDGCLHREPHLATRPRGPRHLRRRTPPTRPLIATGRRTAAAYGAELAREERHSWLRFRCLGNDSPQFAGDVAIVPAPSTCVADAVRAARESNRTCSEVGAMLGVSKQAAQRKFGRRSSAA
jgi:hypothetical protein